MSVWKDKVDFEINKAVVKAQGLNVSNEQYLDYGDRDGRAVILSDLRVVDYCNNPSDAWQIIVENKISIEFIDGFGWTAGAEYRSNIAHSCYDHPLRAAMIVYLEMNGVKP